MPKLSAGTVRKEKHLRSLLGLLALVALPPLLAMLAMAKSSGLVDALALDHAQLARQMADGHGFVTTILRPLTLALQSNVSPHPDLVNAPLHPLLLAGGFALAEPSEKMAPALGLLLWMLTVWSVFWVVRYWRDWRVAGLAAVFCACSTAGLMTATAGLPQPVMALLVFGAVAVVFLKSNGTGAGGARLALWQPAVAGLLCGAAVLTDYRLLPLAFVLGIYLAKTHDRRALSVMLFLGGLLLVLLPWWIRNIMVSGRLFGFYWYSALENTRQFPGESIWRLTHVPGHPLLYLLAHPWDLARKLAMGFSQYQMAGMGVLNPVAVFLCLVVLFGAPARSSRRRLAWLVTSSAVLVVLWSCLTRPDVRLLLALMPLLSCVAAAQLVLWVQANVGNFQTAKARLRVSTLGMQSLAYAGVIAVVAFPVVMQLGRALSTEKVDTMAIGSALNKRLPSRGAVLTDVPAFVSWYLNRPSLLLCQQETDLAELEKQVGHIAGVYLSPAVGEFSRRELGDWWMWLATPRGVYRGWAIAPNSPLPGILRVPQDSKTMSVTQKEWLEGLQKAARKGSKSSEAHAQLAFAYYALGRLQEAQDEFQAARQLDEYNVEALIGLWQTVAQLSLPDGTLQLAQLIGQISSQDPRTKPVLEEAAAHFEQISSQQPGNPWLLLNLIICRLRLGQWNEAETCYARLSQLLPKTFPSQLMLANLYLQQGEIGKAAKECQQLIQQHADMPTAHQIAGRVWLAQGKLEDALKEFAATAQLRPQWISAHVEAGQVCQRLKRYDEAVEHLKAALKLSPNQVNLKLSLADIYIAQGKTAEAIGLYSGILATDAKQIVALNNLAELLTKDGKASEALPLARRAVSLYPQDPHIRDTAGWVSFQAGNSEDAMLHLREAVRLAPKQGISHYHLGKVLLAQHRKEEAEECFRRAQECGFHEEAKQTAR